MVLVAKKLYYICKIKCRYLLNDNDFIKKLKN